MVSNGNDGEHNGHDHYMMGITYKLDGVVVSMLGYTTGFDAATSRVMEWEVQVEAPTVLWYWCHHHTGQGNSFAIADGGAGELDINVKTLFSDPDFILDGNYTQTIDKTGDGDLWIKSTQNSAQNRILDIEVSNAGAGDARLNIRATDGITLHATDGTGAYNHGRVCFENFHTKANVLACDPVGNLILDPNDTNDSSSGVVEIWGDLLVQGTTTTVNSTTLTVDDPIITLGGDTAPQAADSLDRGVEFRYYQSSSARVGFLSLIHISEPTRPY